MAIKIDKQDAENYDSIFIEITHNNKKLIFATVYRPPKLQAADDTALYNEIQSLIQGKNAIVIGDFNCANVDWGLLIGDQEGSRLINMVEDSFLMQVVIQPTRENNILDLVLVSDPDLVRDCEVEEKLGGSNHIIIRFNICVQHKLDNNPTLVPDYRKANFNVAFELLPPTEWEYIDSNLHVNTIEGMWMVIRDKLLEVQRTTVPMKPRRINGVVDPPWITMAIKGAIDTKKRNYNLMRGTDTAEARTYQNSLRACRPLNPKKFFTYIRSKKKLKTNIGPLMDETESLTQDSKHLAKLLNSNFALVFTTEHKETIPEGPAPPRGITPLEIDAISAQDVKKYLDKLDTNKSMGPDSLSPRLLKEFKQQILHPLTYSYIYSTSRYKKTKYSKIGK